MRCTVPEFCAPFFRSIFFSQARALFEQHCFFEFGTLRLSATRKQFWHNRLFLDRGPCVFQPREKHSYGKLVFFGLGFSDLKNTVRANLFLRTGPPCVFYSLRGVEQPKLE